MAFIGFAARAKKLAVDKWKSYKAQKAEDKKIYDEAYRAERKDIITRQAKDRVRKINSEAREDARYGGKFKRLVVEGARAIKQHNARPDNPWRQLRKGPNPWTDSGRTVKNPWR